MRVLDEDIRIRADETFVRLIDRAAELTGHNRSSFIRKAALKEAVIVIRGNAGEEETQCSGSMPS